MLVQPLATRSIRITIANMANRESHVFHCKTTPGPDKVTTTITHHTSAARSLSALVTSAATTIFVLDHYFRNACTRNPNIPSQLTIRSKMETEMKTTNTKRIDKAMFQMKGLVSQKVSFPYTAWSHIYMFEDANPYSAAQTNSEGLTTPLCLSLIHI